MGDGGRPRTALPDRPFAPQPAGADEADADQNRARRNDRGGEPRAAIAGLVIAGFGVGGIIYASSVALLLGRLGERGLMLVGGTLMGGALALVALHLAWPLWAVDFLVLGLGFYMLHGVIQIYASELAPAARGSAMALHSTFFFFGNAVGPVIYGGALGSVGLAATVVPAGAMLIGVGLVCAQKLRRERPVQEAIADA